jgi:hypothetical protein
MVLISQRHFPNLSWHALLQPSILDSMLPKASTILQLLRIYLKDLKAPHLPTLSELIKGLKPQVLKVQLIVNTLVLTTRCCLQIEVVSLKEILKVKAPSLQRRTLTVITQSLFHLQIRVLQVVFKDI